MNNISANAWLVADLVLATILGLGALLLAIATIPRLRDWRAARARPDYVGHHARRVIFVWPVDGDPNRPGTSKRHRHAYDERSDREG